MLFNVAIFIYCLIERRYRSGFLQETFRVSYLIKKMLGVHVDLDEQKVLDAINQSGLKSMRVVGRGTLMVDAKEVTRTEKFKDYARQAKSIVDQSS